jgi:hypothetical protein
VLPEAAGVVFTDPLFPRGAPPVPWARELEFEFELDRVLPMESSRSAPQELSARHRAATRSVKEKEKFMVMAKVGFGGKYVVV